MKKVLICLLFSAACIHAAANAPLRGNPRAPVQQQAQQQQAVAGNVQARAATTRAAPIAPPVQQQAQTQQQQAAPQNQQPQQQAVAARAATTRAVGAPAAPAQAAPAMTPVGGSQVSAARAATNQVIMAAPRIQASAAPGVTGDPCREEYWGCMDMFCMGDNVSGARCQCSNDSIRLNREYSEAVAAIQDELDRMNVVMEHIEHGDGGQLGGFSRPDDWDGECNPGDIACLVGAARYNAADALCNEMVSEACRPNHHFIRLQYSQNIRNDCAAFNLAIQDVRTRGAQAVMEARREMLETAQEAHAARNRFNEGECVQELRQCMMGDSACGRDWLRCTPENIEERRFICESVLEGCQSVREQVWTGFVRLIEPTLIAAQTRAETDRGINRLGNIVECITNSCRANIDGMGETMDACLARPEMVQSFCRVELERYDPDGLLWDFAKAQLAAMRVDRCTMEVRDCFTRDMACGADMLGCLGMDLYAMHRICPVDRLVVCRQDNPNFALADINDMILGLFLNIDNRQFEECHNLIEERMETICESQIDCAAFMNSDFGQGSLRLAESGNMFVITGIVNWNGLTVSDGHEWAECMRAGEDDCSRFPQAGTILINEYRQSMQHSIRISPTELRPFVENAEDLIMGELLSVAGEINRVIGLIEQDQRIGWCIRGRDLSQITGEDERTVARFPSLIQIQRRVIAEAALSRAVHNHNGRIYQLMAEATTRMDSRMAAFACYMKPQMMSGRDIPEPGTAEAASWSPGSFMPARIIGRAASYADIKAIGPNYSNRINSVWVKKFVTAFSPETLNCQVCITDQFYGKRRFVDPLYDQSKSLKEEIARLEEERRELNRRVTIGTIGAAAGGAVAAFAITGSIAVAAGMAGGATLFAAIGATALIPGVGWIAAGVALVVVGIISIFRLTNRSVDPMDQVVTRMVEYCINLTIGEEEEELTADS